MARTKTDIKTVTMNLPNALLNRVDEYANTMNVNRTSAICVLLNTALDSQKNMNTLEELLQLVKAEARK